VRALVVESGDQSGLIVVDAVDADAGGLARQRVAPVGGGDAGGSHDAPVRTGDGDLVCLDRNAGRRHRDGREAGAGSGCLLQGA